jgi:hypothetical protein
MGKFSFCNRCREFHYSSEECPPVFTILYNEEEYTQRGQNHHEAAKKFMKKLNEAYDYELTNQSIIVVITDHNNTTHTFKVSAEPTIIYEANIVP